MSDNRAVRAARVMPVVVVALVAASCGGGGGGHRNAPRAATEGSTSTIEPSEMTTTSTTSGGPGTARVATSRPPSAGARPPGQAPAPAAAQNANPSSGAPPPPTPAQPGKYAYRQSGFQTGGPSKTTAPSQGSLVVDAPHGSDEVWHRAVDGDRWSSQTTLRYSSTGPGIVSLSLTNNEGNVGISATCPFDAPVPAPPWPPSVGQKFSGHANCGDFTLDITGTVQSTRSVTVESTTRTVYVIASDIVTHGRLESTGTESDWFDPVSRLSVHTESQQRGTYGFIGFEQQLTSDLVSFKPS